MIEKMHMQIKQDMKSNTVFDSSLKVSKDGYSFDVDSHKWKLNKDVTISFMPDILAIQPKLLEGFRNSLSIYAQELSALYTLNIYSRFQRMIRDTQSTSIDEYTLLNWNAILDDEHKYYLGSLRAFFFSWHEYGFFGVTNEMVNVLEKLTIPGGPKGVAVANRCSYSGAFTDNEYTAINLELIRLFKEGSICLPTYAYVNTVQATAYRPENIRQLKAVDLIIKKPSCKGVESYTLNLPKAKVRGGHFRIQFDSIVIIEELHLILLNLIQVQTNRLESLYNTKLPEELKGLVPLFIDWKVATNFANEGISLSRELLSLDLFHMGVNDLRNDYMMSFRKKQQAYSERTGDVIHISARRFRYTRGTNLARRGLGAQVIAKALGHSDTQNVKVYTENTADTVTYIDKAVGKQLAPFAHAFLGKVIEKPEEGERGDDLAARIPNKDNSEVGACGTNDFCIKGYEACYLCEKFRPLLDAPHEKFLESLYAEKEARLKETKSETYAATKDRLILAVEMVVDKCKEIKLQREKGMNNGK
ncbi:site-specific integrase [Pseudoalteromonas sp. Hal056]|uniref:site-specific integrase n=1 Tax=Pseudoalteromonas sp. Hal056 TaxID=3035159 RepID=UPI00301D476B